MKGSSGAFQIKKAMRATLEWQITAFQAALFFARSQLREHS
jgi:hypothetical protein